MHFSLSHCPRSLNNWWFAQNLALENEELKHPNVVELKHVGAP